MPYLNGICLVCTQDPEVLKWFHQRPDWLKLNFDGSFHESSRKAGIGGLIRDSMGKLIMAYTAEAPANHPLEAELLALQRGLFHVRELDALQMPRCLWHQR